MEKRINFHFLRKSVLTILYDCIKVLVQSYMNKESSVNHAFSYDVPIYLQIMEIFIGQILRGERARGDQMPAVREVAMIYGVNHNTVQRAFAEMDRLELTRSERTSGRFVVASDEMIRALRAEQSKEAIREFIGRQKALGMSCDETIDMIRKGWIDE